MKEFPVKLKDRSQNCTHNVKQLAHNQNEANSIAIKVLAKLLGHTQLEIV